MEVELDVFFFLTAHFGALGSIHTWAFRECMQKCIFLCAFLECMKNLPKHAFRLWCHYFLMTLQTHLADARFGARQSVSAICISTHFLCVSAHISGMVTCEWGFMDKNQKCAVRWLYDGRNATMAIKTKQPAGWDVCKSAPAEEWAILGLWDLRLLASTREGTPQWTCIREGSWIGAHYYGFATGHWSFWHTAGMQTVLLNAPFSSWLIYFCLLISTNSMYAFSFT